jgi:hypothetical protein
MKSQKLSRSQFNSKLLAYSATAGAALMVAPQAHATIENILGSEINLSLPGSTGPITLGPARGTFLGTHNTTRHFSTFGTNTFSRFTSTYHNGKVVARNIKLAVNGSIGNLSSGSFARVKRVSPGAAFSGLQFDTLPNERIAYHARHNTSGSFKNGGSGYLAFKTNNGHGTYTAPIMAGSS